MSHVNSEVITRFYEAYRKRDRAGIRATMSEDASWTFPGRHPLSGTKKGLGEVIAFFNHMQKFGFKAEQLVVGANDRYVVESQRTWSEQYDIEMYWCVLWRFENGKIVEGRHFAADQYKADEFFNRMHP